MDTGTFFILFVIVIAFVFDFINGFHDAANAIATIVTTGVLTPKKAVLWAAFFNLIAFLVFSLSVAKTIGSGLVNPGLVDPQLIFAALMGAIFWNLATWYYGLPSSSSHALIGGLAGAAVAKAGFSALIPAGFSKVVAGIFISPLVGMLIGYWLTLGMTRLAKRYPRERTERLFKRLQLASSALLSLTHGGNDAQKTMGIIAILLYSASWLKGDFHVPFWVVISCHTVIALGTLAGGWRIVDTMGKKITELTTLRGCAAETGAAAMIFAATELGVPISTTHTVTGAIAGVGFVNGPSLMHWPVLRRIFLAWLLTIPAAGIVAAGIMLTIQ
ncbi:inorganic phosphate transporter [Legionella taurinensis]|uniref:Anion permease n=1 Tax=Legionella taurinensis TaxID=70611 RepID=A0A3A5L4C5_9GAMM|nr:inorganic phosphate transporter [Legionella taurinensis]MDX1836198.1 inorganic phosphate transporter [Legionella taurinensis]PUT42040.1 anion permease [Legionella taurinensis]PUT44827.1 anion permease [Legionella taurinensis]PUT48148.1 anion permease [Legionella taurinensis]PUT48962.1 anion permease [Legionella taurinensis]